MVRRAELLHESERERLTKLNAIFLSAPILDFRARLDPTIRLAVAKTSPIHAHIYNTSLPLLSSPPS